MRRRVRVAAVLAGVLLVVVVANATAYRTRAQADLSANRRFSLAPESRDVARSVDAPLRVTVFLYEGGGAARDARFLLSRYRELNPRIDYRVIDPDEHPGEAARFGVTQYSTVVFEYRGRRAEAPVVDEIEVTSGILRVLRGGTRLVCFLVGHGEPGLDDDTPDGFTDAVEALDRNGYRARTLDLVRDEREVPEECDVVALVGPTVPLVRQELEALRAWTRAEGRLLVLATPFADPEADVNPLLQPWGITFVGGLVVDPDRAEGLDLTNLVVEEFPTANPIVDGVPRLRFPAPGGLLVDPGDEAGLTVSRLAVTSDSGFIEVTPDAGIEPGPGDVPGPAVLAAAADDSEVRPDDDGSGERIARTRVVAAGSSEWATNRFFNELGNRRFLVNALNWLTLEEQVLVVPARVSTVRELPWTAERQNQAIAVAVVLVPGAVVAAGIAHRVLARRRERRRA